MTDWIARAREVAAQLAEDALERDVANAAPVPEADLLRKAELPGLLIPRRYGGAGDGWRTALAVVREIAKADGSIAQLIGYHYVNSANLWLAGDAAVQERWGRPTAENQWLWGDAVNPVDPDLTLTPDPRGYLLSGRKTFATGASAGMSSRSPEWRVMTCSWSRCPRTPRVSSSAATGTTSASDCPPAAR